jgi:alanyl-tRNA synthetase
VTERLYFADPLLSDFTARVVLHGNFGGEPTVVLDRSAFYPESGGQMADRGVLGAQPIRDVQIDEGLVVHHLIEGSLPALGVELEGHVDLGRRRAHMALHSAQHLLSRALLNVAGAETVSSRLGESACTVDVDASSLMDEKIAEAERAVNTLIDEDRPVRAWFPTQEELASLPLRRAPKQSSGIRVVDFSGFDVSPCGGTHVTHTAQVGLFRVTSSERYKGGTRVTFSAGPRARGEARAEWLALSHAATLLETSREGVVAAIERLKERLDTEQEARGRLRAELAARIAESAAPDEEGRVFVDVSPEGGLELARQVASTLVRRAGATAIVRAPIESGAHLIVSRGPGASLDCGALVRKLTSAAGGKGGGRPEHAEGKLPRDFDVLTALRS